MEARRLAGFVLAAVDKTNIKLQRRAKIRKTLLNRRRERRRNLVLKVEEPPPSVLDLKSSTAFKHFLF